MRASARAFEAASERLPRRKSFSHNGFSVRARENAASPELEQEQGHTIPIDANGNVIKTNEYYENIGKYDKFNRGWEDAIIGSNAETTDEREAYLNLRKDANDFFGLATTTASLVIINHLISVGDAIFTAKKLNDEASLKLSVKQLSTGKGNEFVHALSVGIAW